MKVSVIVATYNQKDTIRRAVNSVLRQKTTFDFEVIVMDDGSTDGTCDQIPQDKRVHINRMVHNGLMRNYLCGFNLCDGEYIAFCDGDDYWCDENKLQIQVDYMDKNPDCGLCTTKAFTCIDGKFKIVKESVDYINKHTSFDDLLIGSAHIYAQTYLLRHSDFVKYIDFHKFIKLGFWVWDYPIVLELIKHTRFHCLDFHSAVFIKNDESVTNTHKRWKRTKYIFRNDWIRLYYICKYGCKFSTLTYLIYRFIRDIYSIIFLRWYR